MDAQLAAVAEEINPLATGGLICESRVMNDIRNRVNRPRLVAGLAVAGVLALSVHVVMLQVLHIPFPQDDPPYWARLLNIAGMAIAVLVFLDLARPALDGRSFVARWLILAALLAMLRETLRAAVMAGVVTTAWTFSLAQMVVPILLWLAIALLCTVAAPRLRSFWSKALGGIVIAAAALWLSPAIGMALSPLFEALGPLAHPDVYQLPYPWQVMIPAYLTYAEPVIACAVIAGLVWDRLPTPPPLRLASFVALVLVMDTMVLRTFLFSFFGAGPVVAAMLSESQFMLEVLVLAALTGLTWAWSRRDARSTA
jgi:hypothetical protein